MAGFGISGVEHVAVLLESVGWKCITMINQDIKAHFPYGLAAPRKYTKPISDVHTRI
jgi:hypothetical protein